MINVQVIVWLVGVVMMSGVITVIYYLVALINYWSSPHTSGSSAHTNRLSAHAFGLSAHTNRLSAHTYVSSPITINVFLTITLSSSITIISSSCLFPDSYFNTLQFDFNTALSSTYKYSTI